MPEPNLSPTPKHEPVPYSKWFFLNQTHPLGPHEPAMGPKEWVWGLKHKQGCSNLFNMRLESLLNNKSKNKDAQILLNIDKTTAIIKTTAAKAISNKN